MLTIRKVNNGFIITGDNEEQWIASSNWEVANILEQAFRKQESDNGNHL